MKNHLQHRIFAIHQPNYLPWIGYFHKMNRCDIFVYMDTVQFPRGRSFANRNIIKTPNGTAYLSVPVQRTKAVHGIHSYNDVRYAGESWKEKHLKTVEMSYVRAPFFGDVFALYAAALRLEGTFVAVNIRLIETFARYLGIMTKRIPLSELPQISSHKTQLIIDIALATKSDIYLSGEGARAYNDRDALQQNGIELRYADMVPPEYPQLWGEFIPNLSVLDVLFNCGKDARQFI